MNNREWTEEQKRKLVDKIDKKGEGERTSWKEWKLDGIRSTQQAEELHKAVELENRNETEVQQRTQVIGEQKRKSI